jgi:hypothetical protein
MHKIKAALVESYAGAILIALIASSGVSNFVQPLSTMVAVAFGNRGGEYQYRTQSLLQVATSSLLHALVYFVIALLLLRWLYLSDDLAASSEESVEFGKG